MTQQFIPNTNPNLQSVRDSLTPRHDAMNAAIDECYAWWAEVERGDNAEFNALPIEEQYALLKRMCGTEPVRKTTEVRLRAKKNAKRLMSEYRRAVKLAAKWGIG
jgi:hypothetical protein